MIRKALIVLGLLGAMTLAGCAVYVPPGPRYGYVDGPPAVVVAPAPVVVLPGFGFYGGYYHGGWYGYHRGRYRR